jgi:hypothetical protein
MFVYDPYPVNHSYGMSCLIDDNVLAYTLHYHGMGQYRTWIENMLPVIVLSATITVYQSIVFKRFGIPLKTISTNHDSLQLFQEFLLCCVYLGSNGVFEARRMNFKNSEE